MKPEIASPEFIAWVKEELAVLTSKTREIIASGEQHVPALFVYPMDPKVSVSVIPVQQFFNSNRGKDIVNYLHRQIADDELVKCVILCTETWLLTARADSISGVADVDMTKSIADHPDRKEAIMFNCIQKGMQLLATYIIKRPDNTIADQPDSLLDPLVGVIAGPHRGEGILGTSGRMIIPPDIKH